MIYSACTVVSRRLDSPPPVRVRLDVDINMLSFNYTNEGDGVEEQEQEEDTVARNVIRTRRARVRIHMTTNSRITVMQFQMRSIDGEFKNNNVRSS